MHCSGTGKEGKRTKLHHLNTIPEKHGNLLLSESCNCDFFFLPGGQSSWNMCCPNYWAHIGQAATETLCSYRRSYTNCSHPICWKSRPVIVGMLETIWFNNIKPLTIKWNSIDHLTTEQYSAKKPWFLAFIQCQLIAATQLQWNSLGNSDLQSYMLL